MAESIETIDRDYVDNFSIKELATDHIMPTYFPDMSTDNIEAGMTGMVDEYISTITEDAFNTGSSLVGEAFPTRAKMTSSIYANAAIFQLTNAFATAATCKFVIVIPEVDIRANFTTKEGSTYKYFYIDRDMVIDVEGIPFTLDYDIEIRATYRETKKGWVYSAHYLMDDYSNYVSTIKDPYIKLKQSGGLIAMTVDLRQYTRTISYESIIDNATLNYPTVEIAYTGKLAGFDVRYKAPSDSDYNTQLTPKVIYSLPEKTPFVYFKQISDSVIELSFTTKDSYFQPKFNSELEITIYTTLGEEGNFNSYTGDDYVVTKGNGYDYLNSWMVSAKPIGKSTGGQERMTTEGLQRLTVEGFSTATAITTENDLQTYFNNYRYRYNTNILCKKKRNDAIELLFSAYMYIKNGNYIYPTNTLVMDTNVLEFDYKDGGFYNLDPGYLFSYKQDEVFFTDTIFYLNDGDGDYYDKNGKYYDKDGNPNEELDITPERLQKKAELKMLTESDASYWKLFSGDKKYHLYYSNGTMDPNEPEGITPQEMFKRFQDGEVTVGGIDADGTCFDFMYDYEKEAQAKSDYISFFDEYKSRENTPDLTFDGYLMDYTFKDYKKEMGIDNRLTVFDTDFENFNYTKQFMFTNPFITTITKNTGLVSYFQTFISQDAELNFVNENNDDAFAQFISYHLYVERDIVKEKEYSFKMEIMPSVDADDGYPYVECIYDETDESQFELYEGAKPSLSNFKKELLVQNRLRVVLMFTDDAGNEIGYMEMIPTQDMDDTDHYVFEAEITTDDYITSANTFRQIHICPHCGNRILNSANYNVDNFDYYCDNCNQTFKEGIINIKEADSLLIPINNENIKVTMLYRDPDHDLDPVTDNTFAEYSDSFKGYIWTNIYSTEDDPITFIEPLDMIRSSITYKDYYQTGVDAMDCQIADVPLLKYSILAYKDQGMRVTDPLLSDDIGKFQYFMDTFLDNYAILQEAKNYLGGMNIDAKFYNSYGKSTNFIIGTGTELIDTNNISVNFDVWLEPGVDQYECASELKLYIKDYIETINDDGTNELHISNLIRNIETDFAYVNHLRFRGINGYDTTYQSITNTAINFENLTKEERRRFVPDILVINENNVNLTFYQNEI